MRTLVPFTLLSACCVLAACSTAPKIAQEKTVETAKEVLRFGGQYDVDHNQLQLTINDDPVMRGSFPPYTPVQNLNADYKGMKVSSRCYFGSVLSSEGGVFGRVAGAIQAAKAKSGDKCEIFIDGKSVENLYF
ncbi:MAG: hypothetical protein KZQ80_03750 [Candidatus Thiodiazotropha sp. (ex Monitilora ramsayi)]|nr:hypothetical protein [Candidatus Thiodiazotropha sp. (ex Monitilora ramsayi)]